MNFSVLVACLTGLRCPLFDFLLYHSRMKILTNFLIGVLKYINVQNLNTFTALSNCFIVMRVYFCSSQVLYSKSKS